MARERTARCATYACAGAQCTHYAKKKDFQTIWKIPFAELEYVERVRDCIKATPFTGCKPDNTICNGPRSKECEDGCRNPNCDDLTCCFCCCPTIVGKGCDIGCNAIGKVIGRGTELAVCQTGENVGKGVAKCCVSLNPAPKTTLVFKLPAEAALNRKWANREVRLSLKDRFDCPRPKCCCNKLKEKKARNKAFFAKLEGLAQDKSIATKETNKKDLCCEVLKEACGLCLPVLECAFEVVQFIPIA